MQAPADEVMQVCRSSARTADVDFACHGAPERLLDLVMWQVPAPGGVWVRRAQK